VELAHHAVHQPRILLVTYGILPLFCAYMMLMKLRRVYSIWIGCAYQAQVAGASAALTPLMWPPCVLQSRSVHTPA
jgi:hypothetical protein